MFNKFSVHRAEASQTEREITERVKTRRQEGENNGRETDMSPLLRVGCKLTANRKSINNDNHNNNLEAGDTHI